MLFRLPSFNDPMWSKPWARVLSKGLKAVEFTVGLLHFILGAIVCIGAFLVAFAPAAFALLVLWIIVKAMWGAQ